MKFPQGKKKKVNLNLDEKDEESSGWVLIILKLLTFPQLMYEKEIFAFKKEVAL